jgi:methylmalonyl-CoA mutase N-terminal domain/subunit
MSSDPVSNDLARLKQQWEAGTLNKVLSRFPERRPRFVTSSDILVERVYTPDTCDADAYMEQLGFPGEYPFTRGVQPTMYRGRFWTMRQYAGYATAEETNARYRFLLEAGQTRWRWARSARWA